jgi:PAS domain S-box-containing protein
VFITSVDGRFIDINGEFAEMLGYESIADLKQVRVPDIYADSRDRGEHIHIIQEQGYLKEYPVDLLKKDGKILHTLITTVARKIRRTVTGFQGTIRDITRQKQMENELRMGE